MFLDLMLLDIHLVISYRARVRKPGQYMGRVCAGFSKRVGFGRLYGYSSVHGCSAGYEGDRIDQET